MLGNLGSTELLVIGIVILVVFGSKKLNGLARGLGESTKEMKKVKKEYHNAVKGVNEEIKEVGTPTPKKKSEVKATETGRFKIGGGSK